MGMPIAGQVAQGVGGAISGIQQGQGFVGNYDAQGNLIQGTGGAGNPNGPQVGIDGSGLPPSDGSSPGLGGKGGMAIPTGVFSNPVPGQSDQLSAPGMGGKGGAGIDPTMNLPVQGNMPSPPPMMAPQSGTPGRPVPAAPFTPRGPGFANPGGAGVVQHPTGQIPGTPPMQPIPTGSIRNRLAPMPVQSGPVNPYGGLSPQPLGRPPVTGQITKPNKGIGVTYGPLKGAGRGGILR